MKPEISQSAIKERLSYDPETGAFSRIKPALLGAVGRIDQDGYLRIGVRGTSYLAHRLAWVYVYGEWPANQIDHINGDPSDNRIANLRDVPSQINRENQRFANKNNKLGVKGVHAKGKKFYGRLFYRGASHFLGAHATAEEAYAAVVAKKRELHNGNTL